MEEFLAKLGLTLIGSLLLYFGLQLLDIYIQYWLSLLISFVIVFGGILILSDSDFH